MEVFRWVLKALQQSMIRHKHDDCAVEGWDELCEKVGDIVVERTVSEVMPAVVKNRDGIVQTMNKMGEALAAKQKYADEFAAKHKVSVQQTQAPAPNSRNS